MRVTWPLGHGSPSSSPIWFNIRGNSSRTCALGHSISRTKRCGQPVSHFHVLVHLSLLVHLFESGLQVRVDGGPARRIPLLDRWCYYWRDAVVLLCAVAGRWTLFWMIIQADWAWIAPEKWEKDGGSEHFWKMTKKLDFGVHSSWFVGMILDWQRIGLWHQKRLVAWVVLGVVIRSALYRRYVHHLRDAMTRSWWYDVQSSVSHSTTLPIAGFFEVPQYNPLGGWPSSGSRLVSHPPLLQLLQRDTAVLHSCAFSSTY